MPAASAPAFLASELSPRQPADCLFHVIPVPFEHSVSYGAGTAQGPAAILAASQQLEAWDGSSLPLELGIHTDAFIDTTGSVEQVLQRLRERVAPLLAAGRIPVVLGGEHTVTVGALQAVASFFKQPVGLFQLDAHADLRDSYEGSRLSHACVARRAHEDLGLPLFQFGVRALSVEEVQYRSSGGIHHLDARQLHRSGLPAALLPESFPELLYLSLDVDGLDPAVIRATGTPVPGGPGWHDTLAAIEQAIRGRTVIGFDVVELAPQPHDHGSAFAAALLVYSVMGLIQRNQITCR